MHLGTYAYTFVHSYKYKTIFIWIAGQVGAIRLGISRALQNWEPGLRQYLKPGNFTYAAKYWKCGSIFVFFTYLLNEWLAAPRWLSLSHSWNILCAREVGLFVFLFKCLGLSFQNKTPHLIWASNCSAPHWIYFRGHPYLLLTLHGYRAVGYLTRDARVVERKKYGRAKARKSFQWVKRWATGISFLFGCRASSVYQDSWYPSKLFCSVG